ncbi:hypothetical protein EOD41_08400 [Mucilaginibacter limnophilus]|uniref:Uncharacterized protein n=1 Tax=Mucilaginibacter limnophilus TaxID=1932778 RepID=A0A437MWA8_9SPHI|nr:hypothetical protein [Mucilaginibacter limnophilus]RVU01962.1 hypothetical protein EOD41_08400 [Mucilaginibacter limnophilus]
MHTIIRILVVLMFLPIMASAQSIEIQNFVKFLNNYKVPDELKYNCEWLYAVVRVKTDASNKIVKYNFLNSPPEAMKKSFDFLLGYQFPNTMKLKGRSVVFYYYIDNAQICKPKPDDYLPTPSEVVETLNGIYWQLKNTDPTAILIPNLMSTKFVAPATEK